MLTRHTCSYTLSPNKVIHNWCFLLRNYSLISTTISLWFHPTNLGVLNYIFEHRLLEFPFSCLTISSICGFYHFKSQCLLHFQPNKNMHCVLKISHVPICQLGSDARRRDSHRLAQERKREGGRRGNIVDKGQEGYLGNWGRKQSLTWSQERGYSRGRGQWQNVMGLLSSILL